MTNEDVILTPTALTASLADGSGDTRIRVADITGTAVVQGDAWTPSEVRISIAGGEHTVRFSPGDAEGRRPSPRCWLAPAGATPRAPSRWREGRVSPASISWPST